METPITTIRFRVVGVSYSNQDGSSRQAYISEMTPDTAVQLVPEPTNPYDANAIAVFIPGNKQIGFVPRELAAKIAPFLEGEKFLARVVSLHGGFETWDGGTASLGVAVEVVLPAAGILDKPSYDIRRDTHENWNLDDNE